MKKEKAKSLEEALEERDTHEDIARNTVARNAASKKLHESKCF